ncbi:MAG: sulfite exporter TauE/SafE family protein [Chloroherpetonaceae bacterium]|nr:sulfite exporter TauE/SafE family protein [Chloroherpetonaceae bacterium]MDW8436589.1 sulfite exporter TauE/SafE family protein [Chloroherpetonaceae bacterium]
MEFLGYFGALAMGALLGLIGGGGSILTVPILAYFFSIDATLATAYSLFVVGLTAIVGAASYWRNKQLDVKTAIVFSIPSFLAVYATRRYVMPLIPEQVFAVGDFVLTKNALVMVVFALLMMGAAISMIRPQKNAMAQPEGEPKFNYPLILVEGAAVGALTGFVGAGGGFLIIPALVVLARLPIKLAVGTSLLIIAAKSLIGFIGDVQNYKDQIDWAFLSLFSIVAVFGILLGSWASRFVSGDKLKPAFGWFVLTMGAFVIVKETMWK